MGSRLRVVAMLTAGSLAVGAAIAQASTVSGSSGALSASAHFGTHRPKEKRNWWVTVTASYGGKAVRARAFYQFLFQGQLVNTQYVNGHRNFTFVGHYRDNLNFPPNAVGYPLTVRVLVSAHGRTVYLPYAVQVTR